MISNHVFLKCTCSKYFVLTVYIHWSGLPHERVMVFRWDWLHFRNLGLNSNTVISRNWDWSLDRTNFSMITRGVWKNTRVEIVQVRKLDYYMELSNSFFTPTYHGPISPSFENNTSGFKGTLNYSWLAMSLDEKQFIKQ